MSKSWVFRLWLIPLQQGLQLIITQSRENLLDVYDWFHYNKDYNIKHLATVLRLYLVYDWFHYNKDYNYLLILSREELSRLWLLPLQ